MVRLFPQGHSLLNPRRVKLLRTCDQDPQQSCELVDNMNWSMNGSIVEQNSMCSTAVGNTQNSAKIALSESESTNFDEFVKFEDEALDEDNEICIFAFDEEFLSIEGDSNAEL